MNSPVNRVSLQRALVTEMMEDRRFEALLTAFSDVKVAVLGDFFLDLYLSMERGLSEFSLETHKEAFQVVDMRALPGAAGVVTNNLVALGASASAIAYTGDDGNGYLLRRGLEERGVNIEGLILTGERFTPTYIKPMMSELGGAAIELNRIDIKNRTPNPFQLEEQIIERVQEAVRDHDGILVTEQVRDDGCGVMSPRVRAALAGLAGRYPQKVIMVDSRDFTARYDRVSLKVNLSEAVKAAGEIEPRILGQEPGDPLATARSCQAVIWDKVKRPVFITLGSHGISGAAQEGEFYHPAFKMEGPIDIVGAGDSVLAGIGLAMCAGATAQEAAYIGNLVGSITIQQIGTTGAASPQDLLDRHRAYQEQIQ